MGGFQAFAETNASAQTVQLQIIRVVLDIIAYVKWNFRVMDVSRYLCKIPRRGRKGKCGSGTTEDTVCGDYRV